MHLKLSVFLKLGLLGSILLLPLQLYLGFPGYTSVQVFRPVYSLSCEILGCVLPPQREVELIDVQDLIIHYLEEPKTGLVLEFKLSNKASFLQPYPKCRLIFRDLDANKLSDVEFDALTHLVDKPFGSGLMPVGIALQIAVPLEEPSLKALNYELILM